MDGLQCTSSIREWEKDNLLRSHVPIIAVTANARSEQIATLLDAGMDDVVSKPFRIQELIPKIEELTARYAIDAPAEADSLRLVVPSKSNTKGSAPSSPTASKTRPAPSASAKSSG
jgi:DNA-binding response OmpR family regulator